MYDLQRPALLFLRHSSPFGEKSLGYREPMRPGPARRHWGYVAIETLGATITPLAVPAAQIRVVELLP